MTRGVTVAIGLAVWALGPAAAAADKPRVAVVALELSGPIDPKAFEGIEHKLVEHMKKARPDVTFLEEPRTVPATHLVTGQVLKVGDTFAIVLRVVVVSSKELIKGVRRTAKKDKFDDAVAEAAQELAAALPREAAAPAR